MTYRWVDSDGADRGDWTEGGWNITVREFETSPVWQLLVDLPDLKVGYCQAADRILILWRTP